MASLPERIVRLAEQTVEHFYMLGADARIAAVSGYAIRPGLDALVEIIERRRAATRCAPGSGYCGNT